MTGIKFLSLVMVMAALGCVLSAGTLNVPDTIGTSNNAGNVGVGTSAPAEKLEVSGGNLLVSGTWNPYVMLKSSATGSPYGFLQYDQSEGNYMRIYDGSQYSMVWRAGNVGIGTNNPAANLQIGSTTSGYIRINGNGGWTEYYATESYPRVELSRDGAASGVAALRFGGGGALDSTIQRLPGSAGIAIMGGNVGIGTTAPTANLQVGSTSSGYVRVNGNGGWAEYYATEYYPRVVLSRDGAASGVSALRFGPGGSALDSTIQRLPSSAGFAIMGGNVGIGTTNPTQKLSVNGTVRAKEVVVDTGWSDFVFDEGYKLKALSETEAFVKAEKHLPGIPTAKEVAEHGISIGEMQAKLLAKIEELTLHQIAQDKRTAALEKENVELRSRINEQQAQLQSLGTQIK
jgi:hypothetical protein